MGNNGPMLNTVRPIQRRVMAKANFNLGIEKSLKSFIIVLITL